MKGIIKQVSEMPKGGIFAMVVPGEKGALSTSVMRVDDRLYEVDRKSGSANFNDSLDVSSVSSEAVFLIAVPEFKKVTFEYPWQVERWLLKNNGRRSLFTEPCMKSTRAFWRGNGGAVNINGNPAATSSLSISDYGDQLTWYIKTSA